MSTDHLAAVRATARPCTRRTKLSTSTPPIRAHRSLIVVAITCAALLALACDDRPTQDPQLDPQPLANTEEMPAPAFSDAELALLESLSIRALPAPPPSPSNRVADDPEAIELGHRLFFDPKLSGDGRIACASCHAPGLLFTDGRPTAVGMAATSRNAPTVVGAAHSAWQFWDGRRDSLWAQALGPLEAAAEMGTTRVAVVRAVAADPDLAARYERVFGALPDLTGLPERAGPYGDREAQDAWYRMSEADRTAIDTAFAQVGKAIAAYERRLQPGPARYDRWVAALGAGDSNPPADARLDDEEIAGARLFIDAGRSLCLRCHNGPQLTNHAFHDVGTALGNGRLPDFGRFLGLQAVLIDPFNCLGPYSDAPPNECKELRFINKQHAEGEMGKFKTPTLRGLPRTGPYMHDGRFATLEEVVEHYRSPPAGPDTLEITPLDIDDAEARALAAFLRTFDGDVASDPRWLRPPAS